MDQAAQREVTQELSEEDAIRLSEIMRALASPLRLRILNALQNGPATVTSLCERLDAGQAAVSNHLRLLRHLNLVVGTREGRNVYYQLFDDHVHDLLTQAVSHASHMPGFAEYSAVEANHS
ncbi:metalloregulator ArsR/SmtB family transcription factor [Actinomycetaceae bacterium MB13-C1-2]|nr:metalloregulator ArsR/SmtB family transcription factor [Actinomycetaceae bacterium MB13-C1-2]